MPELVVVVLAFSGLLAALVGLLGFYPELTERVPRHALAGVITTVLAAGVTMGIFVWLLTNRVLTTLSYSTVPGPPEFSFVSLVALIALAFSVVGFAFVRGDESSRFVGGLLLGLAVPWVGILGASALYGSELPIWISLPIYGAIPFGLLAAGYVIRQNGSVTERQTVPTDILTN